VWYVANLFAAERPMTMRDLIEKLKAQPKTVDEHREEQKREWLGALEKLFSDIERWVEPAVQEGILRTSRSSVEVVEQELGNYRAPVLEIRGRGLTIGLHPIAGRIAGVVAAGDHRLVGLRGRVDLVCGPIKIPLVRTTGDAWKALPLRGEPRDLSEESFAEILGEVLLDG
jgi:hypothetical protein